MKTALIITMVLLGFALFVARCCREDEREKELYWQAIRKRMKKDKA